MPHQEDGKRFLDKPIRRSRHITPGIRTGLAAGAAVAVLTLAGGFAIEGFAIGVLDGETAMRLVERMTSTLIFLGSAMMTATATVLALLLTLFSLSFGSGSRLRSSHYRRIQHISFIDTVALIASTAYMLLLLIGAPLEKTGVIPRHWAEAFYFGVLVGAAGLAGLLVSIAIMLFSALRDLINAVALGDPRTPIIGDESEED